MGTVQDPQDIQNADLGVMDTAPNIQHSNDINPSFIPSISQCAPHPASVPSQLIQEPVSSFPAMADQCVLLPASIPLPDVPTSTAFLSSMDLNPSPSLVQPVSSEFLADVPADPFTIAPPIDNVMNVEITVDSHALPVSPPVHIPSPALTSTSPFSVSATSPGESVLDQPVATVQCNTSVSPVPISPVYLPVSPAAANLMFLPQDVVAIPKQDEVSPHAEAESVVAVETMLEDIEQTAKHARTILHQRHDLATGSSINILNERISQVTQKFAGLLSISSALALSPYGAPIQPPSINVPEPEDILLTYSSNLVPPIDVPLADHILDHTRKRCASELEEQRSLKAPKREPQEDGPLNAPFVGVSPAVTTPPFAVAGITHAVTPVKSQAIPSRPPTPPVAFSVHGPFGVVRPGAASGTTFSSYSSTGRPLSVEISSAATTPIPTVSPTYPVLHSSWSDPSVPTLHQHSVSVLPQTPPIGTSNMGDPFTTQPLQAVGVVSPPVGRMSRSGSTSGAYPNVFKFGAPGGGWPINGQSPSKSGRFANAGEAVSPGSSSASDRAPLSTAHNSPEEEDEDDDDDDEDDNDVKNNIHHSSDSPAATSDIPQEYRTAVDRIFFEYLNKICSNLDATDSKGEPIHQTLMAKKMQRLDESPDFRPFKFRIQAFTMGFLEELARSGYPEEKLPMKKVRNYLWRQQYILRFNEDGKKAKSKGNHIWNIEARKIGDGKWDFRPFHRKLAGAPPSVAYCGLKWSWSPRVWDPQSSWQNVPVEYSSPSLPSWLSWSDDVLSGTPPTGAESCRVTVIAKFVLDGQEGQLSHTFPLTVAPSKSIEAAPCPRSRRPSLVTESSRRTSETAVFHEVQRTKSRPLPARRSSPEHPDTRVIRVLQSVAQRVTAEAHTQIVSTSPPKQSELQALVKQKQVVEHSVDAYDKAISHNDGPQQSRLLAVAAQNVVVQAAHTVIADRTAAIGGIPQQQSETVAIKSVTVTELTDATQGAIAAAVQQKGKDSNEVDIMVAATSILKTRTAIVDASSSTAQQPRSLSTAVVPHLTPMSQQTYPLSSVSEYV